MNEVVNIPICRLCLAAPATQTGSHLLSCFLVESMAGKRGKEKIYLLTQDAKLDHLDNAGDSSVIEDNLLCRGCEQRLSYLEGYISQEFIQKINLSTQQVNFPVVKHIESYNIKECLKLNSAAFTLLIASVTWRISLSSLLGFSQFQLKEEEMEVLRKALNDLLPPYLDFKVKPNRKEWLEMITEKIEKVKIFSYVIITPEENQYKTSNLVLAPHFIDYPYSLMLNEFILLIYFGNFDPAKVQEDYYDLGEILIDEDAINTAGKNIKVVYLPESKWEAIKTRFMSEQSVLKAKAMMRSKINAFINSNKGTLSHKQILDFIEQMTIEIQIGGK